MEFFKLIRKYSVEIGSQKERERRKNGAYIRPVAGPVDHPVDRCAQICTGQPGRPRQRNGRPTGTRLLLVCPGRPRYGRSADRRIWARSCISFQDSDFFFWVGDESNWGFLNSWVSLPSWIVCKLQIVLVVESIKSLLSRGRRHVAEPR